MRGYLKSLNWIFKLQPKSTTVGKHRDSDLCLQNGGVNEHHATIEWNENEHCYVLSDLNSAHGTYVNDCHIHNATVRLTPGDEIHFGYGGSAYKLLIDAADPLPVLPIHSAASPIGVRHHAMLSSVTPHPPRRRRPASAGAKCIGSDANVPEYSGLSHRPGSWASSIGRGFIFKNSGMSQVCQGMQDKKKDWLKGTDKQSGVLASQGEAQRKELLALREEVSALRLQLSQSSHNNPDIQHKLHNLTRDIQKKKEEIQQLKEQMLEMQTRTGELNAQAVAERDKMVSNLRKQLDKLKCENSKSEALISSVQKDLLAREKQALKLAAEVDNLRKDARYKDAQLSNMTNKLSKLKELEKHQEEFLVKQKEVESLKKIVEQMELTLREKQKDIKQQNTERDLLKHRLDQKTQEQTSLQSEISRLKLQQQQTLQREQRAQAELRHTQTRLENFCSQIMEHVLVTSETISEQEILDRLSKFMKQKEKIYSKVHQLEQQLQENFENQKAVEKDAEKLKACFAEFQSNIQKVYLVDAMRNQISALEHENVCPAVTWVKTCTLSILTGLHTLLQTTADSLLAAGVEVAEKTGGAVKTLCQQHQEIQLQFSRLQAEKKQLEEKMETANDIQIEHQETKKQMHQKLQAQETHTKIENTLRLQLERTSTDLEAARKAKDDLYLEMETQKLKLCAKLEEAEKREFKLKEKCREVELQVEKLRKEIKEKEVQEDEWERRVKEALQKGAEQERESTRVEIEEYREQVRQHAHTIVALEEKMSSALQTAKEMEKERESLTQQLTEARKKTEDVKPSVSLEQTEEQQQLKQTVTSLRASLDVSQQEVVRQREVVASLSHDLSHAHAHLSDLTGELSEQQKIQLETHKALVVDQRIQLSMLTHKFTVTAQLLEQKEKELKTLKKKLEQTETELKKERTHHTRGLPLTIPHTKDVSVMVSPSQLTNQASKCKGCRREEIKRQGKKTLNARKKRISGLERKQPCKVLAQQMEPMRQDTEEQIQTTTRRLKSSAAQRDPFSSVYVDLARALCEALELSERQLSGCVPLKHLPPGEREHMASLRQEDLELLRSQIALQNSQSQNKDLLLQESQTEIEKLRESQVFGQQLQIELDNVRSEVVTLKLESSKLHQTLQETQTQLQLCTNHRKSMERIGHHNCIPDNNFGKVAVLRMSRKAKRRQRAEGEKDFLINQEKESCKIAAQITSVVQQ
ncbi:Forkhead-associated domain-containing protein 1 [Bagarius yarrelli]|uniref:Forkhead-associated domain-containing protein 1 n=1 Tax=Bagarius yarrelli TaxID=175774 RepID=A0A556U8P1_BAGYA|nr:Forkhead-associated domain-containing protein 1 [Bagarius yarrelli]